MNENFKDFGQCTNNCWIKNKLTGEMEDISNATMFEKLLECITLEAETEEEANERRTWYINQEN